MTMPDRSEVKLIVVVSKVRDRHLDRDARERAAFVMPRHRNACVISCCRPTPSTRTPGVCAPCSEIATFMISCSGSEPSS